MQRAQDFSEKVRGKKTHTHTHPHTHTPTHPHTHTPTHPHTHTPTHPHTHTPTHPHTHTHIHTYTHTHIHTYTHTHIHIHTHTNKPLCGHPNALRVRCLVVSPAGICGGSGSLPLPEFFAVAWWPTVLTRLWVRRGGLVEEAALLGSFFVSTWTWTFNCDWILLFLA